jgi:hypothetical protein
MGVSGQLYAPAALPLRKELSGTHWVGGWVDPTACLEAMKKKKNFVAPARN